MNEWLNAGKKEQPAWCYYDFNNENGEKYGKLYNWHAINDKRGLAPSGWKIPTIEEWKKLSSTYSYTALKTDAKTFNGSPGSNESGFNMIAGGGIDNYGRFSLLNNAGISWTKSEKDIDNAWFFYFNEYSFEYYSGSKEGGFSVRCIRENGLVGWSANQLDEQRVLNFKLGIDSLFDNRNKINYPTMSFGKKHWMTKNLAVKTFRNNEPILEAKTKEEWLKFSEIKQPAWCYYNNDKLNGTKYGILYNWYAVIDDRGLCPIGSHIPSKNEVDSLEYEILSKFNDIHKTHASDPTYSMKSQKGWTTIYSHEFCDSKFELMASGSRSNDGSFNGLGLNSFLWTFEDELKRTAWCQHVESMTARTISKDKGFGMSVRCIKD